VWIDTILQQGPIETQGRSFLAAARITGRHVLVDVVDLAARIAHDSGGGQTSRRTRPIAISGAGAAMSSGSRYSNFGNACHTRLVALLQLTELAAWHHQPSGCSADPGVPPAGVTPRDAGSNAFAVGCISTLSLLEAGVKPRNPTGVSRRNQRRAPASPWRAKWAAV
jgi:hypothetical protein